MKYLRVLASRASERKIKELRLNISVLCQKQNQNWEVFDQVQLHDSRKSLSRCLAHDQLTQQKWYIMLAVPGKWKEK